VTHKSSIGEFKPWAFFAWTTAFLIVAFYIFSRFSFATQAPEQDARVLGSQALTQVTDLQKRMCTLEAQVAALQSRLDRPQKKRTLP
jgi:uncharacterized protein YlxW (UPF0749 family)